MDSFKLCLWWPYLKDEERGAGASLGSGLFPMEYYQSHYLENGEYTWHYYHLVSILS